MTTLFNNISTSGTIPVWWKSGSIVTFLKKNGDPIKLESRRPITLLECIYKLYCRILSVKLQHALSDTISPNQNGFVHNRHIHENTFTVDWVLKWLHKTESQYYINFYDFHKAFDSIDHNAIIRTFIHLKAPNFLIHVIQSMFSNFNVRAKVNNQWTNNIPINRGTFQGHPLSGLIFALVIEPLNRALET